MDDFFQNTVRMSAESQKNNLCDTSDIPETFKALLNYAFRATVRDDNGKDVKMFMKNQYLFLHLC